MEPPFQPPKAAKGAPLCVNWHPWASVPPKVLAPLRKDALELNETKDTGYEKRLAFLAPLGWRGHRGSLQVQPPPKAAFSDTTRRVFFARSSVRSEMPLALAAACTFSTSIGPASR